MSQATGHGGGAARSAATWSADCPGCSRGISHEGPVALRHLQSVKMNTTQ